MIKQGIYQMYSAAYWNLQIICSSKFSEDDDAIDIERQATNMFIWRMRHCVGKLLSGRRCVVCKSRLIGNGSDCAHIHKDGHKETVPGTHRRQWPPQHELRQRFMNNIEVMLCVNCHWSYDQDNLCFQSDGREFNKFSMIERFNTVKTKIGLRMLEEFDALVEGTPRSHGKFLKTYDSMLLKYDKAIDLVYEKLPTLTIKRGVVSYDQLQGLQNIASVKSCRIACASENCVGGMCKESALEIDSISNQHNKFYNNYICLDNGENEWLCFTMKKRPKKCGKLYCIDNEGLLTEQGDLEDHELDTVIDNCIFFNGTWAKLITKVNLPDKFYDDIQILCRACNQMKKRPARMEYDRVVRFLEEYQCTQDT